MAFSSNQPVRITGGPITYYTEYETTNAYVEKAFGGNTNTITITNDSTTDPVQVSWDGATLEGDIKAGESMSFNTKTRTSVYIKATTGGDKIRLWCW